MSNWKLINKTFLYDGTFDGFLTIVFDCYSNKTLPQKIYSELEYSTNFLDHTIYIETDFEKSKRVFNGIEKILVIQHFTIHITHFYLMKKTKKRIY